MKFALNALSAAVWAAAATVSHAAVVQIDGASTVFTGSSLITFDTGTTGPAGTLSIGSVTFGSFFNGQSLGNIVTCGLIDIPCVVNNPSGPLSLASGGGAVAIVSDSATTTSPVLAGSASYTDGSPIAMLFAQPVSAVSFVAGGFNDLNSTQVQLFDSSGNVIEFTPLGGGALVGSVLNPTACDPPPLTIPPTPNPPECFFNFAFAADGGSSIAGILISLVDVERQGFAIDNVRTVVAAPSPGPTPPPPGPTPPPPGPTPPSPPPSQVPEPTSLALVGLGLLGLGLARRRKD